MLRDTLDAIGLGGPYRVVVDACARLVYRHPSLEEPFIRISRSCWAKPIIGRGVRSVAYRLISHLKSDANPYRSVDVFGVPLRVNVTDFAFSGVYVGRVTYEPETTKYVLHHLEPGSVFVDIGANSGYFALLAGRLVGPQGSVFAFEPNPPVFEELRHHVEINALDRIRPMPFALGSQASDDVPLFVTPTHSGFATLVPNSQLVPEFLGPSRAVPVKCLTFDDWLATVPVGNVDLVKVDVDGFEHEVFTGMARSIAAGRIRRIVCETSPDGPAHRMLVTHGYRPTTLESVGPLDNIAYELPGTSSSSIHAS